MQSCHYIVDMRRLLLPFFAGYLYTVDFDIYLMKNVNILLDFQLDMIQVYISFTEQYFLLQKDLTVPPNCY